MSIEALKRSAKAKVDNQAVGRLDPGAVLNRERSFANHAVAAALKGDWGRAMAFKQRQLLHKYMWRELVAAKELRDDKWYPLAAQMNGDKQRAKLGLAGPAYRDVSDALLEAVQATPPRQVEGKRAGLNELLTTMEANGNAVAFDEDFVATLLAGGRSWKELKVSELRQLYDALKNIKTAAQGVTTFLKDGKRFDKGALHREAARVRLRERRQDHRRPIIARRRFRGRRCTRLRTFGRWVPYAPR